MPLPVVSPEGPLKPDLVVVGADVAGGGGGAGGALLLVLLLLKRLKPLAMAGFTPALFMIEVAAFGCANAALARVEAACALLVLPPAKR